MLQTFTCCTFPQAKEHTREVRSLTLFSRLEILISFTHLFTKSPRMPNCFELAAIFEINWRVASGVLSTNAPPTCSINDTTVSRHQSFIEILNFPADRVFDDEGIECTIAQIFPNTRKVSP
jgi:hypothetical protein